MATMVERVAAAIHRADATRTLTLRQAQARAAIEAMREPTEAMVTAVHNISRALPVEIGFDEEMRVAIDEALK